MDLVNGTTPDTATPDTAGPDAPQPFGCAAAVLLIIRENGEGVHILPLDPARPWPALAPTRVATPDDLVGVLALAQETIRANTLGHAVMQAFGSMAEQNKKVQAVRDMSGIGKHRRF